jgi:hypothetical protein
MRAWFVALATTVWAIVGGAGILLFGGSGYCIFAKDPSSLVCSTVGTTAYFDVTILVVGVPVLILIDYVVRNPSWLSKPLTIQVSYLWMTIGLVFVLLSIFPLLTTGLFTILFVLWLGTGVTLATLLIARTVIRPSQRTCQ